LLRAGKSRGFYSKKNTAVFIRDLPEPEHGARGGRQKHWIKGKNRKHPAMERPATKRRM
jgi:hypothetical protein